MRPTWKHPLTCPIRITLSPQKPSAIFRGHGKMLFHSLPTPPLELLSPDNTNPSLLIFRTLERIWLLQQAMVTEFFITLSSDDQSDCYFFKKNHIECDLYFLDVTKVYILFLNMVICFFNLKLCIGGILYCLELADWVSL